MSILTRGGLFWIHDSRYKFLSRFPNPREANGKCEQYILSGNKMSSHVKAIGTCYLTLSSGFF